MHVVGIHLLQSLDLVDSPRRSAVARIDAEGRLAGLDLAAADAEIAAAVPPGAAWVCVDAPLAVPNDDGSRDAERVLAWCDVPAFPVSRRRLATVFGGARGVTLAAALDAPGREVLETLPDLVLRELEWERRHPPAAAAMDLADYRAAWLGTRAPSYRPKGRGRARPSGFARARALLAGVIDLGGWAPAEEGDDWAALHDAARLDALCCAYAALRLARGEGAVTLGDPRRGRLAFPADANLRARADITVRRLAAEGAIGIGKGPSAP
jgi:predicted nuclease with RNAse H fold